MALPNLASDSLKACYKRELGSSGLTYAGLLDSLSQHLLFFARRSFPLRNHFWSR